MLKTQQNLVTHISYPNVQKPNEIPRRSPSNQFLSKPHLPAPEGKTKYQINTHYPDTLKSSDPQKQYYASNHPNLSTPILNLSHSHRIAETKTKPDPP